MRGIAELEYCGPVLKLRTPYHERFIASLKEAIPWRSRKWNPEERCWEVRRVWEGEVLTLLSDYFDETRKTYSEAQARPTPQYGEWDLLYLRPGAPPELVEAAYRTLAKLWHPDTRPESEREVATARMAAINEAVEKVRKEAGNGRRS